MNPSSTTLNDHHRDQLVSYLRFIRGKRTQFLKDVALTFKETRERDIRSPTYAQDEVIRIVDDLERLTRSDVERELTHMSHTNVLLLQQYFAQAEAFHLKLTSSVGQLENRTLMDAVAVFEEKEFAVGGKKETGPAKLAPIVDAATLALFQQEIDRLKAENATLREKAATASTSPSTIVQQPVQGDSANATDVVALREKLAAVEADLHGKLQSSKPVQNMQRMLAKKNEALKKLRAHVAKIDPAFAAAAEHGDGDAEVEAA